MKKLLLLLLLFPAALEAQTARADRFTLNTGPCTMRSGSGAPSGALGVVCDTYIDTTTGVLWLKQLFGWVVSGVTGSGTIDRVAKWTASTSLGDSTITDATGGNLTLAPAGDIILNPTGNDIFPGRPYAINLGSISNKLLTGHFAELWIETLIAHDTMATMGGRLLILPTTQLTSDLASGAATIFVRHNNLQLGDRVYMESSGKVEFIGIVSSAAGTGPFTYIVTRDLDGSGPNDWYAGDAVANTGQAGNGFIDLYSLRGVRAGTEVGPTIVGNVRLSSAYNDWQPRWAVGNLNGLYGYSSSIYGAAFGVPNGARVTTDGTNGIRIYGGDNDEKVTIDVAGNATFDGKLTIGTGRNKIRNSECRISTEDWVVESNTGMTVVFSGPSFDPYRLLNEANACYYTVTGVPALNTVTAARLNGQSFPIQPALRYEASVYLGLHRATWARIMILWYNASNTLISTSDGTQCTTTSPGGTALSSWCRSTVVGTAPPAAYYAVPYVQTLHSGSGSEPYTFFVRSYFGEAGPAQLTASEWGPAGLTEINNGLIKTDAIDARTIAANSITTSELAANSVTAAKIVAGTITADKLNVSTLSAITANLGTVTAGSVSGVTISGSTINAGSGNEVVLNTSGVTFASGSGTNNKIKWGSGSPSIHGLSDQSLWLIGADVYVQAGQLNMTGGPVVASSGLNTSSIRDTSMDGLGTGRFVCHDNDGDYYSSSTTCDGSAPVSAMLEMIQELRAEVEQLREMLARKQ